MRRAYSAGLVIPAFVFAMMGTTTPSIAQAQTTATQATAAPQLAHDEIVAFAKVQIAIDNARDSVQVAFTQTGNKKVEAQEQLQERMRKEVEEVLHHSGMTNAEYQRRVFIISSDTDLRKTYDSVFVALTGVPMPGQVRADARGRGGRGGAAVAPVAVPAGAVGTHIGHVMNAFSDTPMGAGLLRTAAAEAAIATTHAGLAARSPDDLAGMKTHAGHVMHALDPSTMPGTTTPGQGYGMKKAALGVASHIELAAGVEGASANVKTHAVHVATSARNAIKRADQIIALAKQIQAATAAPEAAALLNQIVALTEQLTAGVDGNGDGRITWEDGEGGLQHAEEHVTLLLRGEGR